MRRAAAAAAILLAIPAAAWADTPVLQPTRDVDVTYRVPVPSAGGTSLLQRLRWSASRHVQRVDLPTSGNWMVLDFSAHRMEMVRDDSHEVLAMPSPPNADRPDAGAGFSRIGMATIAGLSCTQWHTVDTRGQETLACYTDDGVLLRASAGPRVLMEAVSVKFEPQPDTVFETPAGYTHQQSNR